MGNLSVMGCLPVLLRANARNYAWIRALARIETGRQCRNELSSTATSCILVHQWHYDCIRILIKHFDKQMK